MGKNNLNKFGLDSLTFPGNEEEAELDELEIQQPVPKKTSPKKKGTAKKTMEKKNKAEEILSKFDIPIPKKKDNAHTTAAIKKSDHLFIKKFAKECEITNMEALHLIIETFRKLYEKHA